MISIIIPTHNAGDYLQALLLSLKEQSIQGEIIVIDSSSSDDTVKTAESHGAKTLIIKKEEFDHGSTRTLAGKNAGGDILVYMTQDALPADKYSLENLIKPFSIDEKIGACFGKQLPNHGATSFGFHLRLFNYPEESYTRSLGDRDEYGIKTAFLSNSFAAYRKKALEGIDWFKENIIMGEDTGAGAKMLLAGYKISYVSDAKVYHSHNYTVFQEFKRYFDIGVFHKTENWLLKEFNRVEGEGERYIKSEFLFLLRNEKYNLLPEFFIRNGLKYIGYKLGLNYKKLPKPLIRKISMHREWFDKQK